MTQKKLGDRSAAVEHLTRALATGRRESFVKALREVVEAQDLSVGDLAEVSGLTRQGLYLNLSEAGNPRLSTLLQLIGALGMRLAVVEKD